MSKSEQLSLFDQPVNGDAAAAPLSEAKELNKRSSLVAATQSFNEEMIRRGLSPHTVKAFLLDLKLYAHHAGADRRIGAVTARDIGAYMHWLKHERDVPSKTKSLERRLTTLKVFFKWLHDARIIEVDPAAPLIHERSTDPLPKILYEDQIARLLAVARQHFGAEKPDARPYLLISLLLQTGMKKGECAGIRLEHLDLSDASAPTVWIRYGNPRHALKERRLYLPKDFADTLMVYRSQYRPKEKLFEVAARNLERVLTLTGQEAELTDGVTFEGLRMTAAVRDYKAGVPPDSMRKKYGLSQITWTSETLPRIKQLAEAAL
ncbi:MAG: site-specific integrase [Chloroflexi bacterium]|nr:site-specific integrase [Chloroflexota bacterium]